MSRVYFHTFGCKANQYDTELLREKMASGGAVTVEKPADADLCLVNSCSVTAKADQECRQFVRRLLRENDHARVVVTGCYATHAPGELRALSPRVEVYSNAEKNSLPACVGFEVAPEVFGLSRFSDRSRAFVKIQDGCRAPCTYCIIPQTRPSYWNKPADQVIQEITTLAAAGHGEIVLTGIRLGLYQGSLEGQRFDLAGLLERLVEIPGDFRIRLSSLEVTEVSDDIVLLAARNSKICRHFHIPMQSADDGVLKDMGRWYVFEKYRERVEFIRRHLPDCGLTADVLVGFPTETEAAFENTYARIESLALSGLHVFPYSQRPGTKAAELPPLAHDVQRRRVEALLALGEKLKAQFRARFAGTVRQVVTEPEGEGWTENYIRVPHDRNLPPGRLAAVRI
ncbi:MAG TPA: tRNA (N(6)-L-threonylcarbamoyladenosine(37)-C(2))-methylthiotransferase MtaB [Elusimicrobiota bacterium]|nr:tRNA (N(6)-L-threonylcarbamoyladenosine(37)-C(2))-methylthiotransferase MtaB [Elusimicrobiota bacterium]